MANLMVNFGRPSPGQGLRDLALRVLTNGAGAALFTASLMFVLVLATHNASDPSWNLATDRAPANIGGLLGAQIADVLIQTIGAAAYILPLVLFIWSLRLMLNLPLRRPLLRTVMVPLLLLLAAAGLGILSRSAGGVVGLQVRRSIPFGEAHLIVALACAGAAGLILAYQFGLSKGEWREVRRGTAKVTRERSRAGWENLKAKRAARRRAEPNMAEYEQPLEPPPPPVQDVVKKPSFVARFRKATSEPTIEGAREEPQIGSNRRKIGRDVVAPMGAGPVQGKRAEAQRQTMLDLDPGPRYELPPLQLLTDAPSDRGRYGPSEESLQQNALLLLSVLEDFGVKGEIVKVRPGPVVTLYELEPAPGTKSARVIGLADDIARSMSAVSVRVAVVPGRNVIGIELPNAKSETVYLRELLGADAYERTGGRLSLVLGKDIGGGPVIADLAKMPHLLIAGTTGSGKSVGINTMILSILYRMSPEDCKFIMIDPKMLELSIYDGIPHLLAPVVTDPKKAVVALKWTVREMENRYRLMSKLGVRNIEGYNQRLADAVAKGEALSRRVQTGFDNETGEPTFEEQPLDSTRLPFIVVVVDEMADLMLVAGKDIEAAIQRLAQMARAAGIHIIMATQRPSVDVITGTIKANFPTRISFQVTSKIDSRTILGESGAEQLLGRGDMLYMAGGGRITRVHGPFVADAEVEAVVNFLKNQGEPDYVEEVTEDQSEGAGEGGGTDEISSGDDLYDQAVALVTREKKASTSFVQRHLQIGYNRAARIMERMEQEGVVTAANHVGKREVLAPPPR